MSGDAFKRVTQGSALEIPAAAWNACLDAAEAHKRGAVSLPDAVARQFRQADIVLVKNASGAAVSRFGVLGISGVIFTPSDSLAAFQNQVAFTGVTPSGDSHKGKFLVCLDPLNAGEVGRAWISGVCQCRVLVTDADHQFCEATAGDSTQLKSSKSGSARILYKPAGTGSLWCTVRLGNAAGGGGTKLGKTTSEWLKNTVATIDLYETGTPPSETSSGETLENCVNKFEDVAAGRWVVVCEATNGYWYLVEYEKTDCDEPLTRAKLSLVGNYNPEARQLLGHEPLDPSEPCVVLSWIDVIECPTGQDEPA